MSLPDWIQRVEEKFKDRGLVVRESAPGEPELTIGASDFRDLIVFLRGSDVVGIDHLADLTAYDESPKEPRFHVVYEFISLSKKQRVAVIVPLLDSSSPKIQTIVDLWSGANWLEREVFDMFGIFFEGHPDLRRMLLPQAFQGHPLRKDFLFDYRQVFPDAVDDSGAFDPFGSTVVQAAPKKTQ